MSLTIFATLLSSCLLMVTFGHGARQFFLLLNVLTVLLIRSLKEPLVF